MVLAARGSLVFGMIGSCSKNAGSAATIKGQITTVMRTLLDDLLAPAVVLLQEVDASFFADGQQGWHSELGLTLCSDVDSGQCRSPTSGQTSVFQRRRPDGAGVGLGKNQL